MGLKNSKGTPVNCSTFPYHLIGCPTPDKVECLRAIRTFTKKAADLLEKLQTDEKLAKYLATEDIFNVTVTDEYAVAIEKEIMPFHVLVTYFMTSKAFCKLYHKKYKEKNEEKPKAKGYYHFDSSSHPFVKSSSLQSNELFYNSGYQWYFEELGFPSAWNTTKSNGIRVAILDTGPNYNHTDLDDNLLKYPNAYDYHDTYTDPDNLCDDVVLRL